MAFIITAPLHCLNAHMIMTSGASKARLIRNIRRLSDIQLVSSGHGTFGCTDTHVTAKVVAKKLHTISHTVRPGQRLAGHSSRENVDTL